MSSTDRKSKTHKVTCIECNQDRFVTYTMFRIIITNKNSGKCNNCGKKNNRIPGVGIRPAWNKGLKGYSKGHKGPKMFGKDNPAYIDGRTALNTSIRNSYQYKLWRSYIFKRDNYTCNLCTKKGGKLVVDHIVPFSHLLNEFIKANNNLNKLVAYKLILKDSSFWNTNNGRVLCYKCHKTTDTYCGRARKWD